MKQSGEDKQLLRSYLNFASVSSQPQWFGHSSSKPIGILFAQQKMTVAEQQNDEEQRGDNEMQQLEYLKFASAGCFLV